MTNVNMERSIHAQVGASDLCAGSNRFGSFDPTVTSPRERDEERWSHAMPTIRRFILLASVLASFSVAEIARAQPFGMGMRGWGSGQDVMGPGAIMGPGMMRYGRVDLTCSPAAAGFVGWRIDRIERSIKPTEAHAENLTS